MTWTKVTKNNDTWNKTTKSNDSWTLVDNATDSWDKLSKQIDTWSKVSKSSDNWTKLEIPVNDNYEVSSALSLSLSVKSPTITIQELINIDSELNSSLSLKSPTIDIQATYDTIAWVESFYNSSSPMDANSETYELTLSSVTNGMLIVTVQATEETDNVTITGITWNGDALTKCTTATDTWYLLSPDSGTHDLVVDHNNCYNLYVATTLYSGVAQEAPEVESKNNGSMVTAPFEVDDTITTATNNSLVYAIGNSHYWKKYTSSASNFTIRLPDGLAVDASTTNRFLVMDLIDESAGDITFYYTIGQDSVTWEIDMLALKPSTL